MLKKLIDKISDFILNLLGWKTKRNPIASNISNGNNNFQGNQFHGNLTIINNNPPESTKNDLITKSNNWNVFLQAFHENFVKSTITTVNRIKHPQYHEKDKKDTIKWLRDKAKIADISNDDPHASKFREIIDNAIASLELFFDTKDVEKFRADWKKYREELNKIFPS